LIKRPDQVFARVQIYSDLPTDGTVHFSQERGGNLNESYASQVSGRDKSSEISHDTTSQGDNERTPLHPVCRQFVIASLDRPKALRSLSGGNLDENGFKSSFAETCLGSPAEERRYVIIGNDGASLSQFKPGAFGSQAGKQGGADSNIVAARAKRYVNNAHAASIGAGFAVSKVCRQPRPGPGESLGSFSA
jgi:hypothetical protein